MKRALLVCGWTLLGSIPALAQSKTFTEDLVPDSCTFSSTGRNSYFILEPGYRQVLQGIEGADTTTLTITVLNETRKVGGVDTRVVEEREVVNGRPVEISRNYFAYCPQTASVYYFGEEVDMYKNGKVVGHEGGWVAEGNNKPGVLMPGLTLLGARYYEEVAPGMAMDRAEIVSTTGIMNTPAGRFTRVLQMEETTPLEPKEKEYKYYAPGVGLIKDEGLVLVQYGFLY